MDNIPCSSGRTKPKKSSHVFTWTVENFDTHFSKSTSEAGTRISSPVFDVAHPDEITLTRWYVNLAVLESRSLQVHLCLKDCPSKYLNNDGLPCTFSIHFGTEADSKVIGETTTYNYTACEEGWGWTEFYTVDKLRSDGLLADDLLQLRVELTIDSKPESSMTSTHSQAKLFPLRPTTNFESLLGASELSDVEFRCASETFPAHKAILAGASDVFRAMFTCDMEEVNSGVIHVTDMTSRTLETILRHMYTGKVDYDMDPDSLLEVIYAAEKYGLAILKHYFLRKLVACICEETVGGLAVVAHLYGAEEYIKMNLRKFIEPRFFDLVKKRDFKMMVQKYPDAFF